MSLIEKTFIFGLGSGRCGTLYLYDLLHAQKGIFITNEKIRIPWYSYEDINLNELPFCNYVESNENMVGDVGSYLLPHVDKIAKHFSKSKLIILQRNKEETIKSWMRWTNIRHNYWTINYNDAFEKDPYDPYFPKFEMDDQPKENAIAAYYDLYYEKTNLLKQQYDSILIETEKLSNPDTQKSILDFIEINVNDQFISDDFRKNKST